MHQNLRLLVHILLLQKFAGLYMCNWKQRCVMNTEHVANYVHIKYVCMQLETKLPSIMHMLIAVQFEFEKLFQQQYIGNILTWARNKLKWTISLNIHGTLAWGRVQRMYQDLSIMHSVNHVHWYLTFNRSSSEEQPLKTMGKTIALKLKITW